MAAKAKPAAKKSAEKKPTAKKPTAKESAAKKPARKQIELKTKFTGASVDAFIDQVENEQRRLDAREVLALMQKLSGAPPRMLGPSIIAFGHSVLTYPDGRTLDWCEIAFSPRKANLVLYLMDGYEKAAGLMAKLGKHKVGRSCLYLNRLADVDRDVLSELIRQSLAMVRKGASK